MQTTLDVRTAPSNNQAFSNQMPHPLVTALRRALADNGDPTKAKGMRQYMKSEMPYRGVQTPLLRRICRGLFLRHPIKEKDVWCEVVLDLWRKAENREERYAALVLAGAKPHEPFRTLDTLPLWEELVVTGAWWDYVDRIAPTDSANSWRDSPMKWPVKCGAGVGTQISGNVAPLSSASSTARSRLTSPYSSTVSTQSL